MKIRERCQHTTTSENRWRRLEQTHQDVLLEEPSVALDLSPASAAVVARDEEVDDLGGHLCRQAVGVAVGQASQASTQSARQSGKGGTNHSQPSRSRTT
jgi:hypothetical protein